MNKNLKKIINNIKKINVLNQSQLNSIINNANNEWELFYNCNIQIFEKNNLNHNDRLKSLNLIRKLQTDNNCNLSIAHNLSLTCKVKQELNLIKDAIKDSLKSHQLFKKEHNNHPLAVNGSIFAYSNLANIYSNLGLNNIALDYLYKGQKLIHESEQPYIPTVRINMTLANVYSKLNKLEKSIGLLNEIYISALEKELHSIVIPALINLSSTYRKKKEYKKAMQLNSEALVISKKIQESHFHATILTFQAQCFEDIKEFDKALDLYKKGLKENLLIQSADKINSNYYSLGCLLVRMNKKKHALNYFEKIIDSKSNGESLQYKMNAHKKIAELLEKADLKKSNQHYKQYINYFEKDYEIKQQVFTTENKNTIESLEVYIDNIQKEKENEKLKDQLSSQKRELITKKVKTLSENNFLKDIIIELKKNISEDDGKIRKKINITIELLKHRIDESSDWKQFLTIFNELNPTFIPTLENQSSELSDLELRVCAMIKFGLHTREIANILSITIRGVEQHRYRIKKKLNIDENITTYLRSK